MNDSKPEKSEFRLPGGTAILDYMRHFSPTEKAIFGLFALGAAVSALFMAYSVSDSFMIEIPAAGGELREGVIGLPHTINPVLAVSDVDRDLSALVFSGLLKPSDGSFEPDLAASYSISEDGKTYSFMLKPELFFQDGRSLTSEDVAFTIQKIQDPALKSPRRSDWADVTVTVVSPTEVKFTLKQAYSPFLSNATIGIIPKHLWQDISPDQFIFSKYNIEPVGSGPYKIASVVRDADGNAPTEYRLAAWRNYQGQRPFLRSIIFRFYADNDKALSALKKGEIDSLGSISPEEAVLASDGADGSISVTSIPMPRIFGVFLNPGHSPVLADKTVRQALNLAVDRESLVKNVLGGYGEAISGPLPAGIGIASSTLKSDIVAAQDLLEKNGWKKNASGIYEKKGAKTALQTLSFDIYTSDAPDLEKAANEVKNSWNAMGARVAVKVFDSTELYQNVIRPRKYDALLFGQQIGKDRDFYAFWHSSQVKSPGLNVAGYANSKADKLLEEIRGTTDEATRSAKYHELDSVIRGDMPAIFLYSPDFIYISPKSLRGLNLEGVTVPSDRWNSVALWYNKTEKVWKIFSKTNL